MSSAQTTPDRTLTVTWEDPIPAASDLLKRSGEEGLQRIVSGEHPRAPIQDLVGFDLIDVSPGSATFKLTPHESHFNPIGSVHGGISSLLLDSAMGSAVQTLLPAGTGYGTIEMKINLIRPVHLNAGDLLATGTIIHTGRRIATAEAKLTDSQGKLYAHGTSTCMIMQVPQP